MKRLEEDTGVAARDAAALSPQEGLSRSASQAEPTAANALKPCPWCDAPARVTEYTGGFVGVSCANDDCVEGLAVGYPRDAVDEWNARPNEDRLLEALKGLRAAYLAKNGCYPLPYQADWHHAEMQAADAAIAKAEA